MPEHRYRLVRRPRPVADPPALDDQQRKVVEHVGGPLLVLAGPGTGKTTTIVEAVVERIEDRGIDPERILVLTFSRKAAQELRERIIARLRRTTREPLALTLHSYAYSLLRRESVLAGDPPPRVLSGPEHLLEVRRLLLGEADDGARHWPARLRPVLRTRGFALELRDFLLRVRERGVDDADLVRLGRSYGRNDWEAVGGFLRRYAARFAVDPTPAYDYADLVQAAATLMERPDVLRRERFARQVIFVDEYQDTDPAQERLLAALAGDGGDLVVVGDPDQSIYAFRGAEVRGVLDFPTRFKTTGGSPAPVIELAVSRRSGPVLLEASRRVASRLPAAPGGNRHRELRTLPGANTGEVSVKIAGSRSQEAALVADVLRRAHLLGGVPWSRMAVLVRSATRQLPVIRRALSVAGVPTVVASDDMPLAAESGARPLILLLRCALRPEALDETAAEELLTGPIGRTDALGLRRLRRALRMLERRAGGRRPAGVLLVEAVRDHRDLSLIESDLRAPAERVGDLLELIRGEAAAGATVEDILWKIWTRSGLSRSLPTAAFEGGSQGAAADRDLDAVVALFEAAARFVERLPRAGPEVFLDDLAGQEIPGDTLAEQSATGEAVRLLTAHRAKGLEWDLVVVAGVQEGVWPDLRLRGSLLGVDDLVASVSGSEAGAVAAASKLLDEERRLFYVAATRARRQLVVTAVGGEGAEERPSRFLGELAPGYDEAPPNLGRSRSLSLTALVAELRSVVTDPKQSIALRRVAAQRLAELATQGVRGAHPREWYALTEWSDDRPLASPDEPVRLSPSQVERFQTCGLRWLLETAVHSSPSGVAQRLGSVVHAVAAMAGETAELDAAELTRRLDEVWDELEFDGPWFSRRQREIAHAMIERFVAWLRENSRALVEVELPFAADVDRARIRGRVDRLERDGHGRAVVIDLKTGTSKPPDDEVDRHPQLAVYQLAAALGAFEHLGLTAPGGAELVQLGKAAYVRNARVQAQRALPDDPEPRWAERLVAQVAEGMSAASFVATANDGCRTCPVRSSCPLHDDGAQVVP